MNDIKFSLSRCWDVLQIIIKKIIDFFFYQKIIFFYQKIIDVSVLYLNTNYHILPK